MCKCIWNCAVEDRQCDFCIVKWCDERCDKNDKARLAAQEYVRIMEEVMGFDICGGGRKPEKVWARNMVAYQMFMDGYSHEQIGRAIKKSRCTIYHAIGRAQDMLNAPSFYRDEVSVWREFRKKLLSSQKQ